MITPIGDYKDASRRTYRDIDTSGREHNLAYLGLGLAGESGELAGKISKIYRDDNGTLTDDRREDLLDELGDVLWYIQQIATNLDTTLEAVATRNALKLDDRLRRGVISGNGDKR